MVDEEGGRRKRKWDDAPDSAGGIGDAAGGNTENAAAVAAAAAARVNEMLVSKGAIEAQTPALDHPNEEARVDLEINDHPGRRFLKSHNIKTVESKTGCAVVTKGRYYPPGEPSPPKDVPDAESRLFLKITGPDEAKVQEAKSLLEEVLEPPARPGGGPGTVGSRAAFDRTYDRVWVNMDPEAVPTLNLLARLRGKNNANIDYISKVTDCSVELTGRGAVSSARDPLHFAIRNQTPYLVKAARDLCLNLVYLMKADFEKHRDFCAEHYPFLSYYQSSGGQRPAQGYSGIAGPDQTALQQQQSQGAGPHPPPPPPPPPPSQRPPPPPPEPTADRRFEDLDPSRYSKDSGVPESYSSVPPPPSLDVGARRRY